jgi:hypothetical protein
LCPCFHVSGEEGKEGQKREEVQEGIIRQQDSEGRVRNKYVYDKLRISAYKKYGLTEIRN